MVEYIGSIFGNFVYLVGIIFGVSLSLWSYSRVELDYLIASENIGMQTVLTGWVPSIDIFIRFN